MKDINEIKEHLAKKVIEARKEAKLSQEDLARLVGVSRASMVNYEKVRQSVSFDTLCDISRATGKSLEFFLPVHDHRETLDPAALNSTIPIGTLRKLELLPLGYLKLIIKQFDLLSKEL